MNIFLKERVTWPMWLATLIGFLGIVLVLQPHSVLLNKGSWCFLVAAGLFGLLDVLNKKYVTNEPMLCMLFYSTLLATIGAAIPALQSWYPLTTQNLLGLAILGGGSNLVLYCLLHAFRLANTSFLAPFRYLELLISVKVGYTFFQEIPSKYSYLGAAIIIYCYCVLQL